MAMRLYNELLLLLPMIMISPVLYVVKSRIR